MSQNMQQAIAGAQSEVLKACAFARYDPSAGYGHSSSSPVTAAAAAASSSGLPNLPHLTPAPSAAMHASYIRDVAASAAYSPAYAAAAAAHAYSEHSKLHLQTG